MPFWVPLSCYNIRVNHTQGSVLARPRSRRITVDYLLAHDVGTSGDKAALLTTDGRVVATAYEP